MKCSTGDCVVAVFNFRDRLQTEAYNRFVVLFAIMQKMVGMYFTYSQVIDEPGKYIKIVAYPKWKYTCLVFFDVEVEFCCLPGNVPKFVLVQFAKHSTRLRAIPPPIIPALDTSFVLLS